MKNITFINAGAGSGKTYRLTVELNKAIIEKECKADEVMLTTFTKKAADEIKVKSMESLLKEGLFIEANDLTNAYIGTVHAVCQKFIQKFWHYIGFPKEIKVMDEADTDFYFSQAIADVPSIIQLERLTDLSYKFNFLGNFKTVDTSKWKDDLLKIIELARTNNILNFENSKIKSLDYAKKILNTNSTHINYKDLDRIIDNIIKIGEELPEARNKTRKKAAKDLKDINKYNIQYSELKKIKLVIDDFENQGLLSQDLLFSKNQLEAYHRTKTLLNDIDEYNNLLFDIAEKSIKKYTNYKQEIGLIDYSDMEKGFLELLEIKEVQKEVRDTVKLVMVDEFQDSSPIQLAIFIKLSFIVNRSIWVGDPKQSIYSFRGTDPILIDAIVKRFEENQEKSLVNDNLEYSWRSRPEIVDCVNKIFKPALKDQVKEKHITLKPVRTDKGFKLSALHHFNLVEFKTNSKGENVVDATKPAYFKSVAKSVVKVLNESWIITDKDQSEPNLNNPDEEVVKSKILRPSDIAILCKGNDEVNTLTKELNNFGIKVSSESDNLKNTAEYYLIISLIKLILSKENVLAKAEVKILTETSYNVGDLIDDRLIFLNKLPGYPQKPNKDDLKDADYNEELKKYINKRENYYNELNSWGKDNLLITGISSIINEIKDLPLPQLIEHLVNRLNIYNVTTNWGKSEQRRSNIQKIIEYAYKYDDRCINMNMGASIMGFIHYLDSQSSLTESKSVNDDSINVLTYHKSKGLEWPLVILTELQKDVNWGFISRNVFGIFIENKSNINIDAVLIDRDILSLPWCFGAATSNPSEDFVTHIKSLEEYRITKSKHENELKRVMYVGMTRPRDYLITTGMHKQPNIKGETLAYPWLDIVNHHDNWRFEDFADVDTGKADVFDRGVDFHVHKLELNNDDKIENKEKNKYFLGKKLNHNRDIEPYFISPSKVKINNNVDVSIYADIQNRIPTGSSAKDKVDILGNCLHDILYFYLGNKLNDITNNSLNNIERIIINYRMDNIINSKDVASSIDLFYDFICKEFKPKEWYRELSLETEINGQVYKGEVDLLLEVSGGFILIDYKSYPGQIERILDRTSVDNSNYAGKYLGQLNTYEKMIEKLTCKKVLKKLIYYTVLGKMVEFQNN
ncbi:AAA family ATPase [Vicingus serpentipes]|uniref:DNA 3'-5' helicase n=1 Tax=Vicingus serpentipes TaxID=1926625 RepID=A0A5C6RUI4_9FLAO|nr:UvrD-helicase domain-containing protein [Vicingus serpentipes]TXB66156.1 AAA family ATPase [Vicingus serpentipes]